MKTNPKHWLKKSQKAGQVLITATTLIVCSVEKSTGQFQNLITYGRTNPPIQKIGIGNFPTNANVAAKLHINQFLLAPNPPTDGFLFRTDGNISQNTLWQMFTGTSATSQTEKFRIMVPANSGNVLIRAVQPNSSMQFQTAGPSTSGGTPTTRMTITDGVSNGFIGIGENFLTPQSRLHQHEITSVNNFHQFTNISTGNTATDGLKLGIDANGAASYNLFENRPHIWRIGTGTPVEWMRIQHGNITSPNLGNNVTNGYVGLNEPNPFFHVEVNTPAFLGGELFFGAHPSDVPNSRVGFCNVTFSNNKFLPTVFGNLDGTQNLPAFQTLANIDGSQDLPPSVNNNPVHRFVVGKNWKYNQVGIQDIDTIINRVAFTWQNAGVIKMMMNADGQLRIGAGLNIPATLPNNRVEITASVNDPYNSVIPINGASGLRFTHLTSLKTPLNNSVNGVDTTKVLSVDQNGDVVLVRVGGGTPIGNCSAPTTFSAGSNGAIDLSANNNNFYFIGQGPQNTNNLYIGYLCGSTVPFAKLNVLQKQTTFPSTHSFAGFFENQNTPLISLKRHIGIVGQTILLEPIDAYHIGGAFRGYGAQQNVGVIGMGDNSTSFVPTIFPFAGNIGGAFLAIRKPTPSATGTNIPNYGVWAKADSAGLNFGIYAEAPIVTVQTPGGAPAGTSWAGYFNGDVVRTGTDNFTSDINLKTNIDTIPNILQIISQLNPRTFYFTNANHPQMHLPSAKQYGFIAQDIEPILPELVMNTTFPAQYDSAGNVIFPSFTYKNLNYQAFHAISIRAIQELYKKIKYQDSIIQVLSNTLYSCCQNNNSRQINNTDITLNNSDAIILNQNVPNPFAEKTVISYHIPEKYTNAQIIFATINGQILKTVDISGKKSRGQITVYADDLSSGVYIYYLLVDGKIIDTKKMQKQ
ncbi:MAG: tail fiber domain-containing protein [Bacteroidia bacterium]|nr:tail fiber domain-containing protein [Bacteroidia bacterium]